MQRDLKEAIIPNVASNADIVDQPNVVVDQPKVVNAIYYEKDEVGTVISDLTGVGQHSLAGSLNLHPLSDSLYRNDNVPSEELYEELYDHAARIEEKKKAKKQEQPDLEGPVETHEFFN